MQIAIDEENLVVDAMCLDDKAVLDVCQDSTSSRLLCSSWWNSCDETHIDPFFLKILAVA